MKTERNQAAAASQELYAAGVAVTAQAQSELRSADIQYSELREKARIMNTNLAESEFKRKSAEDEVHKLRRILKEAEERIQESSTKFITASRERDGGVLQLYA